MPRTYFRDTTGDIFSTEHPDSYQSPNYERMTATAGREALEKQSRKKLRELCAPGTTVYCVLRSVAPSGMSRRISFFVARDGSIRDITHAVAESGSASSLHRDGGLLVKGCGMDMGFSEVYNLSARLYPEGNPLVPGDSGGYALKHQWL